MQGGDATSRVTFWQLAVDRRNTDYRQLLDKLKACKAGSSTVSEERDALEQKCRGLAAQVAQLQVMQ